MSIQPTSELAPSPVAPGPVIAAPDSARAPIPAGHRGVDDEEGSAGHNSAGKRFAGRLTQLPEPLYDAAAWVASNINNVVHRTRPANPPVEPSPGAWRFAALGDFGDASNGQKRVAANILQSDPDLLLTLGDNVYEQGREFEYRENFDPPELFGNLRESLPVYPTLGNHDIKADPAATPYHQRFGHLDGARYYSFDHRGVRFAALDSNETFRPGSPQYDWLDSTLADAGERFKVVYFHHPLLNGRERAKDDPRLGHLGPLLARHGVHLVLNGHDHIYERTRPLNERGTIQLTSGTGGRMPYPILSAQDDWSAFRDVGFGHVEVEVREDALVPRYISDDGRVLDTVVIPKVASAVEDAAAAAAAVAA